jgi:hypothetical protein
MSSPSAGSKKMSSKEPAWKQVADRTLFSGFLLGLFLGPDDEDDMSLRKAAWLSTDYMSLYPGRRRRRRRRRSHFRTSVLLTIIMKRLGSLGKHKFTILAHDRKKSECLYIDVCGRLTYAITMAINCPERRLQKSMRLQEIYMWPVLPNLIHILE